MPESIVCLRNSHKDGSWDNQNRLIGNTEIYCFDYHFKKYDIRR